MRVLAIQLKRIGDLLQTLPALRAAKAAGDCVTLVLAEGPAALLPAMSDFVDQALVYRRKGLNRELWMGVLRGGFGETVDFTGNDRSALLTLASRAPERIASRDAIRGSRLRAHAYTRLAHVPVRELHTADYYLGHREAAPVKGPDLRLPPDVISRARARLAAEDVARGEFIVIHPGSAREEKYWEPERWAAVIDFCQGALGRRCVLTGGSGDPFETSHLARIRSLVARAPVDFTGQLDLLTLAAVICEARVFVGVDSGPMHLAAVWQKPQLALFGQTNPFHWRPRHERSIILQAGVDAPLRNPADFNPSAPKGLLNAISTLAVTGCIEELSRLALDPPRA